LCRFFGEELMALELALRLPESKFASQYSINVKMMNLLIYRQALCCSIATEALTFSPPSDAMG
jgi:hypothetical protein